MPPRWMQPKLAKMKRAYLKKYKSTGVDQAKVVAYDIFKNSARVKTTSGGLPIQNNSFMVRVPDTYKLTAYNPEASVDPTLHPKEVRKRELLEENSSKKSYIVPKGRIESPRKLVVERKHLDLQEETLRKEGRYLKFMRVWVGNQRNQGVTEFISQRLIDYPNYTLTLYFSGNEALFVSETGSIRRISRTYVGLTEAWDAHRMERIAWVDKEQIQAEPA